MKEICLNFSTRTQREGKETTETTEWEKEGNELKKKMKDLRREEDKKGKMMKDKWWKSLGSFREELRENGKNERDWCKPVSSFCSTFHPSINYLCLWQLHAVIQTAIPLFDLSIHPIILPFICLCTHFPCVYPPSYYPIIHSSILIWCLHLFFHPFIHVQSAFSFISSLIFPFVLLSICSPGYNSNCSRDDV